MFMGARFDLPPESASRPKSFQMRHIEHEMIAGVLAVSAALPASRAH